MSETSQVTVTLDRLLAKWDRDAATWAATAEEARGKEPVHAHERLTIRVALIRTLAGELRTALQEDDGETAGTVKGEPCDRCGHRKGDCDYCDGEGGYWVTSGRMVDGKPVEKTRWVTCERCGGHKVLYEPMPQGQPIRTFPCPDCAEPLVEESSGRAAGHDFKVPAPSLAHVLAHFESEADAADEMVRELASDSQLWMRYTTERDTYRYVLKQIRAARPDNQETAQGLVIDAAEFAEAQHDPKVKALLRRAGEYGRSLGDRDHSIPTRHDHEIREGVDAHIERMQAAGYGFDTYAPLEKLLDEHGDNQETAQTTSGDEMPWNAPGDTPCCDCAAHGLKRLDQHAEECPFRIEEERSGDLRDGKARHRLGREWWEGDDETVSGADSAYCRTHARLVASGLPPDESRHEAIRAALSAARRYVVEGPDHEEKS